MTFSKKIIAWQNQCGRHHLPWHHPRTDYRVWLAEIMLQQTQVTTVIPYFERFCTAFPDVFALATADLDSVLLRWSGLGYYARARHLHQTAQQVVQNYQGVFPRELAALQALPGIGRSTAAAILASVYNAPTPILDGNVKRVFARHWAISGWTGSSATLTALWARAEKEMPKQHGRDYNQGLMDLGALLCKPKNPLCTECPVKRTCSAFQQDKIHAFPGKKPSKSRPERRAFFLLIKNPNGAYLLEKRPARGIWGGLWCLPECPVTLNPVDWISKHYNLSIEIQDHWPPLVHEFSHFSLTILPVLAHILPKKTIKKQAVVSKSSWSTNCSTNTAPTLEPTLEINTQIWYNPLFDRQPGGFASPVTMLFSTLTKRRMKKQLCPV